MIMPIESGRDRGGNEQDNEQTEQHGAAGNAARRILVLDFLKPGKVVWFMCRPGIGHRSTFDFHGKPITAQLKSIFCMRWHSTSE